MSMEVSHQGELPALPMRRSTTRKLAEIREELLTARATVQAQEAILGYQAACKIDNGYALASHTIHNASQLHHEVSQATMDNPSLEMSLRGLEEDVAYAARSIVHRYMTW